MYSGNTAKGLRIGLFGGSFDPAHGGHRLVAERAMKKLGLDAVWWLLSPYNPLKAKGSLYADRLCALETFVNHPRMRVSGIENDLGTFRTLDTIKALKLRFPWTQFVFIAGLDSAASFPRWYKWRDILNEMPVAFVNRAPERLGQKRLRLMGQAGIKQVFCGYKTALAAQDKRLVLWLGGGPASPASSTAIRQRKKLDAAL